MTDPSSADAVYIEPITPEFVTQIIAKERPDALLPTMGGQTALNTALALEKSGVLKQYNVELIGANAESIERAEDRLKFRTLMDTLGLESPKSHIVRSMDDARQALPLVGLPAIIRPSFTLAGTGGGIAYNSEEFEAIVSNGLKLSPVGEVLVEESVLGWKEYEMEVVRDRADNAIIVCSIENIDPMGIHTGDSITVAPALTLTDKEYQKMRDASLAVLRAVGVETGGSNVQFAVDPKTGRQVVIEMNPRVSRSSALASKATGFPIAKIAAKLAVGYTLDELKNDITRTTPAAFEPTIDYVVTKIPRFAFEKFPGTTNHLTTAMKSVGEVMGLGRNFKESLQKALASMETGLTGLNAPKGAENLDTDGIRRKLAEPTPDRLLWAAEGMRRGLTPEDIYTITKIDPWFLRQIGEIVETETAVRGLKGALTAEEWLSLKRDGFTDARLAELLNVDPEAIKTSRADVSVVYKRVDTCAAEFAASTAYMYSTYEAAGQGAETLSCEAGVSEKTKILILGGGPNRIGQGIEFDYCCVHAVLATRALGHEAIMVNCNPETVSTDYDLSDRLYFEPLTEEHVIQICQKEQEKGKLLGVIVQFGGQTPLKLAHALEAAGIPILGTSPDAIDLAEDRERFQQLLHKLGLKQPANAIALGAEDALTRGQALGFPLVVRPSYVLGGRAMAVVHDTDELKSYLDREISALGDKPILLDSFLNDAYEIDVDALCDGQDVFVAGIMEHIEEAGIHSGDSACCLPPHSLSEDLCEELKKQTRALALALKVRGLMNIQFAIRDNVVYVLEVNPRASRTVPFVAKATGLPLAAMATRIMAGQTLGDLPELVGYTPPASFAVKESVFPFSRFPGVDVLLGPEMKSTGEVMGRDTTFARAYAKAQIGAGTPLPVSGRVFLSVRDADKDAIVALAQELGAMGFALLATGGTAAVIRAAGCPVETVLKVGEGRPDIVDALISKKVDLVINTTSGSQAIKDSFSIRRTAVVNSIPYVTTLAAARATVAAMGAMRGEGLRIFG
jgi:carbamoyl-phosphate synthase large subunit